jgi:hypothetical protein
MSSEDKAEESPEVTIEDEDEDDDPCYLCGHPASLCDPHTQSRLWVTGIPYRTPCGTDVELSAHIGCIQHENRQVTNGKTE